MRVLPCVDGLVFVSFSLKTIETMAQRIYDENNESEGKK